MVTFATPVLLLILTMHQLLPSIKIIPSAGMGMLGQVMDPASGSGQDAITAMPDQGS